MFQKMLQPKRFIEILVIALDFSGSCILDTAEMRSEMYPIPLAHGVRYMVVVPLPHGSDLIVGASAGDAGDVSRLGDLVRRMEEEVGLPVLEGGTVGGEDDVEGGPRGG